jgi:hypothetical protein
MPSVSVSFSSALETRALQTTNNNYYELNASSLGLFRYYPAAGHGLLSSNYFCDLAPSYVFETWQSLYFFKQIKQFEIISDNYLRSISYHK